MKFSQKQKTHFVSGLLVLAPLFLTVLVVRYLVRLADAAIVDPLFELLPIEFDAMFKVVLAKFAIAAVVILVVWAVGWTAEKFIFRNIISAGESFLSNIPLFNRVYVSIREIAQAFFGDKSGLFKRVVVIEYPRPGLYALGFVTQEKRWELNASLGKETLTVFVPSPPNPATGFFVFVPKEQAIELNISIEEAIRTVISGGAVVPPLKPKP